MFFFKFNRWHVHLPLAGTGSLCGAPNSTSVLSKYKFGISAMHLNVSPPVVDGGEPWKCELCSCNLRLVRVATKLSVVVINCCSAEYCCSKTEKKRERENIKYCINMENEILNNLRKGWQTNKQTNKWTNEPNKQHDMHIWNWIMIAIWISCIFRF